MRRLNIFCLLWAAVAIAMFTSCDGIEPSGNGSLDGFWQLTRIDTLSTGGSSDVRERKIFWSVQSSLIQLSDLHDDTEHYGENAPSIFFHFEHTPDSLHLLSSPAPVIYNHRVSERADERPAGLADVAAYGLSRTGEDFRVLHLSKGSMTLQSDWLRMHFRKY